LCRYPRWGTERYKSVQHKRSDFCRSIVEIQNYVFICTAIRDKNTRGGLYTIVFQNSNYTKELSLCHKHKFFIPISLHSDNVNVWYFKLWIFNITGIILWNILCLRHPQILGIESQSLWQRLNFFIYEVL